MNNTHLKLGLIGYGKMNRGIELLAKEKGCEVVAVFDSKNPFKEGVDLKGANFLIDFSIPELVPNNVKLSLLLDLPLVIGTTGWGDRFDELKKIVVNNSGYVLYGANFSIGVLLFSKIVSYSSKLFSKFSEYEIGIHEIHHSEKKDSPSGTALMLLNKIQGTNSKFNPRISSLRVGKVPGTHTVYFDSNVDTIKLEHTARSRDGFIHGALISAEWLAKQKELGNPGFFSVEDMIQEVSYE